MCLLPFTRREALWEEDVKSVITTDVAGTPEMCFIIDAYSCMITG